MKLLDGKELAEYIKERQARQVRGLRQAFSIDPVLAIVRTGTSDVTDVYLRLKQSYGQDIGVDVQIFNTDTENIIKTIETLNGNESVHGIIVQLPLQDTSADIDTVLNAVKPQKDVDGLGAESSFDAATPQAILWLLAGYNIDLRGKDICIVGRGRLVGDPLEKMLKSSDLMVRSVDEHVEDLTRSLVDADIIISAAGSPGIITSGMIKQGAVVVDAGTSSDSGEIKGDVDDEVRQRDDLKITPLRGGVGPLTVAALFDNLITAARQSATVNQ